MGLKARVTLPVSALLMTAASLSVASTTCSSASLLLQSALVLAVRDPLLRRTISSRLQARLVATKACSTSLMAPQKMLLTSRGVWLAQPIAVAATMRILDARIACLTRTSRCRNSTPTLISSSVTRSCPRSQASPSAAPCHALLRRRITL